MEKFNEKKLFIEVNDNNFIFVAGKYDENLNFDIIEKKIVNSVGVKEGKIVDLNLSSKAILSSLDEIEKKLNHVFKDVNIISDHKKFQTINISGFKKLNGAQIIKEDISYILNNIKRYISENEVQKSIIHLFNSKYILDNNEIQNLPIGLHGEFYGHQLTFFLLENNDLKNIKQLFGKCNLNIEKIILKSFIEGVSLIESFKDENIFIKIKINKNTIYLSVFENLSYTYYEILNFGSDLVSKDISKVCSLKLENIIEMISELCFDNFQEFSEEKYLNEKYFKNDTFRKISLSHIANIAEARIKEITDIIFNKNSNLKYLNKKKKLIYINFEDLFLQKAFKGVIEKSFKLNNDIIIFSEDDLSDSKTSFIAANLAIKGWSKEAIPYVQTRKTIISRIFSAIFD